MWKPYVLLGDDDFMLGMDGKPSYVRRAWIVGRYLPFDRTKFVREAETSAKIPAAEMNEFLSKNWLDDDTLAAFESVGPEMAGRRRAGFCILRGECMVAAYLTRMNF